MPISPTVELEVLVKVSGKTGAMDVPVGVRPKLSSDTEATGGVPAAVIVAERGTITLPVSDVMNKLPVIGVGDTAEGAVNWRLIVQLEVAPICAGKLTGQSPPAVRKKAPPVPETVIAKMLTALAPELLTVMVRSFVLPGATTPKSNGFGVTMSACANTVPAKICAKVTEAKAQSLFIAFKKIKRMPRKFRKSE
jgi:hypothetical protein